MKRFIALVLSALLSTNAFAVSYGSNLGAGTADGPDKFANFAAFPASAQNGDLAVDQSTTTLYGWNGSWSVLATPSTVNTVGALDGQPKNANAATISGNTFYQQTADATWPGVLSAADWTTFNNKEPAISAGLATDYYRGDKTFQPLNGSAVANTPAGSIAATDTQAAIDELDSEKEPNITATTAADYYRGDKTFQTLNGAAVAYTPVADNWLVDPANVQEALDNLAGAKIGNLWYVSRTAGVDSAACGMALNPCASISQALTNMGASADADDVKNAQTVLIEGGAYDESLTIPDGRFVNLIGLGTVILGDAAGANLGSTTPRSIAFNPTNASVFGSALKPSLTIGTINPSEMTSTFVAEANGFYISGDIAIGGDGVTHNVNLHGVKLFGDITKTSLGLTNMIISDSYIVGTIDISSGQGILERVYNSEFDGLITVTQFNHIQNSEIDGGMTVSGVGNFMPPSGMFHVDFAGTFTGVANSARMDLATDYFFRANGASLAGGATKVILSPVASSTVDGILSATDWSTFNSKLTSTLADSQIFVGNGSNVATAVAMSGDATIDNAGVVTVSNSATADALSANPADCAAGQYANTIAANGDLSCAQVAASEVSNAPAGGIAATDVQAAIDELDSEKQAVGDYITELTGEVSASGPGSAAATLSNAAVIGKVLTGYSAGAGVVAATDSILEAIQKLDGNIQAIPAQATDAQEVPAGLINNSNVTYTLANTPTSNTSVSLYQDGLILIQGTDYTIVGDTITMTTAPNFAQTLYAVYTY